MVKKNKFKNVLVVLGGTSGERAISLQSGKACIKALRKKVLEKTGVNLELEIKIIGE